MSNEIEVDIQSKNLSIDECDKRKDELNKLDSNWTYETLTTDQ